MDGEAPLTNQPLWERLGVRRRILQAPIGSLASLELAAAVSNAGGLGSLALSWTDPETAAARVRALKQLTPHAFFVNFVLAFEPTSLPAVLEAGVPMVSFSWGRPGPLVGQVHAAAALVAVQVATVSGAKAALDAGCDLLICQGIEAGGHVQSTTPLEDLVAPIVEIAGHVPVIAAGGLAIHDDVARVIALGASGAMLGTRFIASDECPAHEEYKRALLAAGDGQTALTNCFDGGWPYAQHRVLRNKTLVDWESAGCPPHGARPGEGEVVATSKAGTPIHRYDDAPPHCALSGDVLACCLYAGTGVGRIAAVQPAAAIVESLWGSSP